MDRGRYSHIQGKGSVKYLDNWSLAVLCSLLRLETANSQPLVGLGPKSVILKELVL